MRVRAWPVLAALWWVGIETWRSGFPFSGMPFGRLVFATADTPWADALPWIGMTGVSFLVALTGTTLAWVVLQLPTPTRTTYVAVAGLAAVTLAPVLVPFPLERTGTATVAAVQGDVPGTGLNVPAVHREVTANHVQLTRELAAAVEAGEQEQPDFVVWPENSTAVDPFLDTEVSAGIVSASDAVGVPIIVGGTNSDPLDDTQVLNQGIVYQPGLGGGDRYTKRHPVPYGEYIPFRGSSWMPSSYGRLTEVPRDMVRGTSLEPLRVGEVLVADAICFDVAYDEGIAGQVARGAEVVTVQTSNAMFSRTGQLAQQFEISRLRAQETGRWVVVAAINGISGVVRPDGTVVASVPARGQEVLVETVDLSTTTTPAVRLGVWPARLAMLFLVLHTAAVLLTYRRRRQGERPAERPDPLERGAPA
jgi:apolipoprotein N-acyltransferase